MDTQSNSITTGQTCEVTFPTARYFQIHFEHLENQLKENHHSIEELKHQLAELHCRLTNQEQTRPPLACLNQIPSHKAGGGR